MDPVLVKIIIAIFVYIIIVAPTMFYFLKRKPKYVVAEDGILIDDLILARYVPNNTIKSVKMISQLPELVDRIEANRLKANCKGNCRFKIGTEEKEALAFVENFTESSVIEIVTTSDLIFINMKYEEMTKALFDEIINTVRMVNNNELVVFNDKRKQKYFTIFIPFIGLINLLFVYVIYNIVH